jgi:hypothetical protein
MTGLLTKKIKLTLILTCFALFAQAQYKGQWRAIHAYELATQGPLFGMNFAAEYFPLHYLSVVPSYTVFLPATGKASSLEFNLRYYPFEKKKQVYGVAGFNSYFRDKEFDTKGKEVTQSLLIGTGGMFKFNSSLGFNPEIKYLLGPRNEFVFNLGVVYYIN